MLIQPIYWYHSAMFVLPGFKRDLSLLYHLEAHVLPPVLVMCKNSSKGSYNLQLGTVYNTRNLMSHLTHCSLTSVCIFLIHFFKVLIRRICSTIKSFFRWWSFPLFSCMIHGRYYRKKLDASHCKFFNPWVWPVSNFSFQ